MNIYNQPVTEMQFGLGGVGGGRPSASTTLPESKYFVYKVSNVQIPSGKKLLVGILFLQFSE